MGKIVFLGDSITASANVSLSQRWAHMVGLSAGYAAADIVNAGVPGNISQQMLARLQTDVLAHTPDVVVMMFTVNDRSNSIPLATHETNYRSLIEQCRLAGAKVVLMSPPVYRSQLDTWGGWVEKWRALAGEYLCPFVDIWRDYASLYLTGGFGGLYVDGADLVHQSVAGNTRIHAVAMSGIYTGAFVKGQLDPPAECQSGPSELQLAAEDLVRNGANVARLARVSAALSA
ncbi:GDSL-type esterase/lipase family protein [Pseudomonas sp. F(2018)]|uniref:SGNH/GDSL hydrolase family protein n=1 Tax=Pseudomonas sp. F(2018) TaxID=2502240 RepID=UPI0010F43428|nr:GDSL-type esterase/lipase family protein [Pseudomonas sp. F(2018)]